MCKCFCFFHQHVTSLSPPLCTVFAYDLASGCTNSSEKQNKAIWFLRPYAAPALNNRPGETTLSRSQSQWCSLLIPALCVSLSEELTGHRPFRKRFSNLNLIVCFHVGTMLQNQFTICTGYISCPRIYHHLSAKLLSCCHPSFNSSSFQSVWSYSLYVSTVCSMTFRVNSSKKEIPYVRN